MGQEHWDVEYHHFFFSYNIINTPLSSDGIFNLSVPLQQFIYPLPPTITTSVCSTLTPPVISHCNQFNLLSGPIFLASKLSQNIHFPSRGAFPVCSLLLNLFRCLNAPLEKQIPLTHTWGLTRLAISGLCEISRHGFPENPIHLLHLNPASSHQKQLARSKFK